MYNLGSSVRPYLLPVPQLEALELPISVERANLQSLTQNMIVPTANACALSACWR